MKLRISKPWQMLIGLVLGAALGMAEPHIGQTLQPVGTIFVNAMRMVVMPLMLASVTLSIYRIGSSASRMGWLTLVCIVYFVAATVVCGVLGLAVNQLLRPGLGYDFTHLSATAPTIAHSIDWVKFVSDIVPVNIISAMASGNLLSVLVFAVLLGLGLAATGERAKPFADVLDSLLSALFKMVTWIVAFAPLASFALVARLFATHGLSAVEPLFKLLGATYLGFFILVVALSIILKLCGYSPFKVIKGVSEPLILGFTCRQSEATLPLHMEKLGEMGLPGSIVSTVLPLGTVFNRDAGMFFLTLVIGFLADGYHVTMTLPLMVTVLIVATAAIDGSASMPSAGMVSLAVALTAIGLPLDAIAIIVGVDAFFDMGRTAVNIYGNTVAAHVVARLGRAKRAGEVAGEVASAGGEAVATRRVAE